MGIKFSVVSPTMFVYVIAAPTAPSLYRWIKGMAAFRANFTDICGNLKLEGPLPPFVVRKKMCDAY